MKDFNKIGTLIKNYRENLKMSQEELSQKTGIPLSKIKKIENGEIVYQFSTLEKIAKALNKTLPEFLDFGK